MKSRFFFLIVLCFTLLLGFSFAGDINSDTNSEIILCTTEGKSMPVYPGYFCCEGLSVILTTATDTTGRITAFKGTSTCSNCGNNTCESWENYVNCPTDCPVPNNSTPEQTCGEMVYSKAKLIADSVCGEITGVNVCNLETKTWWFDLVQKKEGCSPACVVNVVTGAAEINWRCTGLIVPGDSNTSCACTMEYAPVCGQNGKTYSNSCNAKCAGIEIVSKEACPQDGEGQFCGGIAGISCPDNFECKLDGKYPDAGGKCVKKEPMTCPLYVSPLCLNGKIVVSIDERGCSKPICKVDNSNDLFYRYVHWTCSNGEEFKEGSDVECRPYSYWKELARNKCAAMSTKCAYTQTVPTSATSSGMSPITGNISGIGAIETVDSNLEESTVTDSNASEEVESSSIDGTYTTSTTIEPGPIQETTTEKCVGGNVFVEKFEVSVQCDSSCKYYADDKGCKIVKCENGISQTICPKDQCKIQPYEEIKAIKDKCYSNNGKIVVKLDESKCQQYICSFGSSSTTTQTCTTQKDIPQEKYSYCNENGGKYMTKFDDQGCLVWSECVGVSNAVDSNNTKINKALISDSTKLLDLALKLESLKVTILGTAEKTTAIADYYTSVGKESDANKFYSATNLLNQAITKIETIKELIKNNVSNFTEEQGLAVKKELATIKEEILREVLLTILG